MKQSNVRIEAITIQNFKNITNSNLNLINPQKPSGADILGLYGANGSGKTALIDAIEILKLVLCGEQIPNRFLAFICADAPYTKFRYQFRIEQENGIFCVLYEFCIKQDTWIVVSNETLSYSFASDDAKYAATQLVDTDTPDIFVSAEIYNWLIGSDEEQKKELMMDRRISALEGRSFIFSRQLLRAIKERKENSAGEQKQFCFIIKRLSVFGKFELFVRNDSCAEDVLPLLIQRKKRIRNIQVPLSGLSAYPLKTAEAVKEAIRTVNIVLPQIIPGLQLDMREQIRLILENGEKGVWIRLFSCRDGQEIPLKYESKGVKKIISILSLLIGVYNRTSLTVAVDDLDKNLFEYLLGEILRIIAGKGKGQLIFTAHNLRPLETLNRGCIVFTTADPHNHYIRMNNTEGSHNLRDFYYRDIILEEQNKPTYNAANNYEIALAFRKAGEFHDTDARPSLTE